MIYRKNLPFDIQYDQDTDEWVVHWENGYAAIDGMELGDQAYMIAAAPRMLEWLEYLAIRLQVVCDDFDLIETDIDLLKKLIAEAKGLSEKPDKI